MTEPIHTVLDTKRLPAALVAAFLLQTAGALFWAGSAAERIAVLERTTADNQKAIERVAVLNDRIATMREQLSRIEAKLDRLQDRPDRRNTARDPGFFIRRCNRPAAGNGWR